MSDDETQRIIGALEARMGLVEDSVKELGADVKEILQHVSASKGSWKTLGVLGGLVLGIGTLIGVLVDWLKG